MQWIVGDFLGFKQCLKCWKRVEENEWLCLAQDESAVCLRGDPACVYYSICDIVFGCIGLASCACVYRQFLCVRAGGLTPAVLSLLCTPWHPFGLKITLFTRQRAMTSAFELHNLMVFLKQIPWRLRKIFFFFTVLVSASAQHLQICPLN